MTKSPSGAAVPPGSKNPPAERPGARPDVVVQKQGVRATVDRAVGKTVTELLGKVIDPETAEAVGRTVGSVVSSPEYPIISVLIAIAFLILQGRLDRRDPKLALAARSSRENEQPFVDLFPTDLNPANEGLS